jgi:hypothetical protein
MHVSFDARIDIHNHVDSGVKSALLDPLPKETLVSHRQKFNREFRDLGVLQRVCAARGIALKISHQLPVSELIYQTRVDGVASFQLPGWQYPVVIDQQGVAHYDNYNNAWGPLAELEKVAQDYYKELTIARLAQEGYQVESIVQHADQSLEIEMVR